MKEMKEIKEIIEAINNSPNPITVLLANVMWEAQRQGFAELVRRGIIKNE
ncbi:hypothetical protein LCGC14_2092680 [marine sediment metagenome]|uniref:Uncharacterized protein n=1 Tax=marine sediment metagenome TaxID=412755 RepID=A0A0F9ECG1_9ZZZZ